MMADDAWRRLDPDSPPDYWESSGYSPSDWHRICGYFSPKPDCAGRGTVIEAVREPTPPSHNPFTANVTPEDMTSGSVPASPQQPNPYQVPGVPLSSPGAVMNSKVWSA